MTRQTMYFILITLITIFVIWYLLGGTGAPFSAYVKWSTLTLVCQGGIFVADRIGREANGH